MAGPAESYWYLEVQIDIRNGAIVVLSCTVILPFELVLVFGS